MRSSWFVILLSACGSVNSARPDASESDVDSSVPVDANPCFGGGLVQLCLAQLPLEPFVLDASRQIDTDRDSRCTSFTPANPAWCVISATRITIGSAATLSAVGRRPLVLVATEAFQIDGTIDVASHLVGNQRTRGAGGAPGDCVSPTGAGWPGGGAGGSFRTRGGNGGSSLGRPGAGVASAATAISKLRGGCSGGFGGAADTPGGAGGEGGGAVYLLAPSITVARTGVINASGSGGQIAGDSATGGGGGGSGGMIGLEAPAIQLAAGARLFANGGGGGEGNGCPVAGQDNTGASGEDPRSPTTPALGGRRDPNGGDGGDGALSTGDGGRGAEGVAGCSSASVAGGGGGGGGGGGAIVLRGTVTDVGAQISPPPIAMP